MTKLVKLAVVVLLAACKQYSAAVLTEKPWPPSRLLNNWKSMIGFGSGFIFDNFQLLLVYERSMRQKIKDMSKASKAVQHADTKLALELKHAHRHLRSIISYAVHSRCFKTPKMGKNVPLDMHRHALEKDWRARYDYYYYSNPDKGFSGLTIDNNIRIKEKYIFKLRIDDQKLCSVFLAKLIELDPSKISASNSDKNFFQKVIDNKVKSPNTREMQILKQNFFRNALAPRILEITKQSMARANFLFPFHTQNFAETCKKQRDRYYEDESGYRTYHYPQEVRRKLDCSLLQQLPPRAIRTRPKNSCDESMRTSENVIEQPFADAQSLSLAVNHTLQGMNASRAKLDRLIKQRVETTPRVMPDDIGGTYALPQYKSKYTEKQAWLWPCDIKVNVFLIFDLTLPCLKILNATKIEHKDIIKAIDAYHCHLIEATKNGVLPIVFAKATQQETGSVHLNHMGRFFGFGQLEYKQLKLPSQQTLNKAIGQVKRELVANWLELQIALADTKKIDEKKIYATMLNNEIAVSQLLLQDPTHAVAISDLLLDFQHEPVTPKWLRTYKNFALAADLAFIPIAILGGIITGGLGTIPLLLMANAINFLWVGSAAAEQIVARNRYRMVERALLTGNSEQIERGEKLLREFHEKRRNRIVSGVIGAPLTLANLRLIAKGLDNLATVPIDIVAAFSADVETLSMPDEYTSDASLHSK